MIWNAKVRAVLVIGDNLDVSYWLADCYEPGYFQGFKDMIVPSWFEEEAIWLPGVFMWIPGLLTQLPLFIIG